MSAATITMPKKRAPVGRPKADEPLDRQIGVRVKAALIARLDHAATGLGLDVSGIIRMIVTEHLPEYEERVRKAYLEGRGKLTLS